MSDWKNPKATSGHKVTGLVCPKCRQPVAIIDDHNPTLFKCPACGHEWTARVN